MLLAIFSFARFTIWYGSLQKRLNKRDLGQEKVWRI